MTAVVRARGSWIATATALALLAVAGCSFEMGPVELRILTGGVRYDDFVIQPIQEYGRLHSSKMVLMDSLVVASEEDLLLPKFQTGWTFVSLLVSAYHPEFLYAWTGKVDSSSKELILSPLRPRSWADYLEEHGEVSLAVVAGQLDLLRLDYVPVFEAGEPRKRLRRYLPGLRALVEGASWLPGKYGSSRGWANEAEARADLKNSLDALAELMQ